VTGIISNALRFENCAFISNSARQSHRGGAIDILSAMAGAYSRLVLDNCIFENNTAHQGGAIYGEDVQIIVTDSQFVENRICGGARGGLGPAIFLRETTARAQVECVADGNVFDNNRDDYCLDPGVEPLAIYGCAVGCGDAAAVTCQLFSS
jgi:predicted outer membrane repeat protein